MRSLSKSSVSDGGRVVSSRGWSAGRGNGTARGASGLRRARGGAGATAVDQLEGRQMFSAGKVVDAVAPKVLTAALYVEFDTSKLASFQQTAADKAAKDLKGKVNTGTQRDLALAGLQYLSDAVQSLRPGVEAFISNRPGAGAGSTDPFTSRVDQLKNGSTGSLGIPTTGPSGSGGSGYAMMGSAFDVMTVGLDSVANALRNQTNGGVGSSRVAMGSGPTFTSFTGTTPAGHGKLEGVSFEIIMSGGRMSLQMEGGTTTDGAAQNPPPTDGNLADAVKSIGGLIVSVLGEVAKVTPGVTVAAAAVDVVSSVDSANSTSQDPNASNLDKGLAALGVMVSGTGGVVTAGEALLGVSAEAGLAGGFGVAGILVAGAASWVKVGGYAYNQYTTGNIYGNKTPDPNSMGGDGTLQGGIITSVGSNKSAPKPGVGNPTGTSDRRWTSLTTWILNYRAQAGLVHPPGAVKPGQVNPTMEGVFSVTIIGEPKGKFGTMYDMVGNPGGKK